MEEFFRDVAGYEGLYQVSNLGNVRSLGMWVNSNGKGYFKKGRVLKSCKHKRGYLHVGLCNDGKQKTHLIHRLVAQAFIENPENLPCINHKDEDKTNNAVTNLEYCDYAYNNRYGTRTERMTEAKSKKVLQLTLDGELIKEWASVNECHRNGFDRTAVWACCNNKYCSQGNVYKGYRWMYAD